jgi:hypothetical protein
MLEHAKNVGQGVFGFAENPVAILAHHGQPVEHNSLAAAHNGAQPAPN